MKIETLSIVAGSEACNARCPFCISKMTPERGMSLKTQDVNWLRFEKALGYAKEGDTNTAMITSKGEPTLFPDQISNYLTCINEFENSSNFSFKSRELQTNGIMLMEKPERYNPYLQTWRGLGLDLIAISIVHFEPEKNRQIYLPYNSRYIDLPGLVQKLHDFDFKVRLACVAVRGFIDSAAKTEELIAFARGNMVEQLTIRPVNKPEDTRDLEIFNWTSKNHLLSEQLLDINSYLIQNGKILKKLPFGGVIYDIDGQNVCLTNSLTHDQGEEYHRQLIFYPDGTIATDWTKQGEVLS